MTTMADSRSGVVIEVCVDSVESAEAYVTHTSLYSLYLIIVRFNCVVPSVVGQID